MVEGSEVAAIDRLPELVVLDGTNDVGPVWILCGDGGNRDTCNNVAYRVGKAEANAIQPTMAAHQCFARVSRFDFGGQLCEEGQIAVEFHRQTTEHCLGRDNLAVNHLKQLYRVHAQLRAEI
jgi:hypothetical protein